MIFTEQNLNPHSDPKKRGSWYFNGHGVYFESPSLSDGRKMLGWLNTAYNLGTLHSLQET